MTNPRARKGWPVDALPPEPEIGPWQTKHIGPLQVRYRRKDRYAKERRDFRRRWLVLKEHFARESGLYRLVNWLAQRFPG